MKEREKVIIYELLARKVLIKRIGSQRQWDGRKTI